MRVTAQHCEEGNGLALSRQALRHLERNQAAKGITGEEIGPARLYLPDRLEIELRHIFDPLMRDADAIDAFRLDRIDRLTGLDPLRQREDFHDVAAQAMRDEDRRQIVIAGF